MGWARVGPSLFIDGYGYMKKFVCLLGLIVFLNSVLSAQVVEERTSQGPVPAVVRRAESNVERQVRKYHVGVRGGVALDPELILIGAQAQLGPIFKSGVSFRPSVEFAYGEVTSMFGFNGEMIYKFPQERQDRWSPYAGGGIGINLLHQNFENKGKRIDFGDFHSDTALNIVGGLQHRNGAFVELRTSIYSDPSPTLRIVAGYNW